MKNRLFLFLPFLLNAIALSILPSKSLGNPLGAVEKRCGWLANPTPGNLWLNDSQESWTISVQGGWHSAKGIDLIPDITTKEFVKTNGGYGYGCACMDVVTDRKKRRILSIQSFQQLPLKTCQADKSLIPLNQGQK
jgi:hypothetical protein